MMGFDLNFEIVPEDLSLGVCRPTIRNTQYTLQQKAHDPNWLSRIFHWFPKFVAVSYFPLTVNHKIM